MTFPLPPLPHVRYDNHPTVIQARATNVAPRYPWDKFTREILDWRPGEHFALIGPTGQGKTTMLLNLLPFQPYVVVFATKPRDDSMDKLIAQGYQKMNRWQSLPAKDTPRRVLWPPATTLDSVERQREIFHDAFDRIFRKSGWTVALDEAWYMANILKLDMDIRMYLLQGRSLGISLVSATQRPAYVPLEIYSQSTHLMFWRDNDRRNLDRLSELNITNKGAVYDLVSNLEPHQVLYVNTRNGRMARTRIGRVTT